MITLERFHGGKVVLDAKDVFAVEDMDDIGEGHTGCQVYVECGQAWVIFEVKGEALKVWGEIVNRR